jgi:hypothetical protein
MPQVVRDPADERDRNEIVRAYRPRAMTGVRSVAAPVALACVVGATAAACTSFGHHAGTSPRPVVTYSEGLAPSHGAPQWTSPAYLRPRPRGTART